MKCAVKKYIEVHSMEESCFSARCAFPESFTGFDGHFPDNPVLPGVCLIQAVLAAAEKATGRTIKLKEIVLAKFMNAVGPDESVDLACTRTENTVRAKLSRGEDRVAEIRLKVEYA